MTTLALCFSFYKESLARAVPDFPSRRQTAAAAAEWAAPVLSVRTTMA